MDAVFTGLDVLFDSDAGPAGLRDGARLGLVVHPASVDRSLVHAGERFVRSGRFEIVRLFAPEHGAGGQAQDMESVGAEVDRVTGAPVTSLYGDRPESLRPDAGMLAGLDAVVYDLQDVGSRYYTYIATLSFIMEAAGNAGVPVIVLDRPNPLGGEVLEGPVLHPSMSSFVGRYPIPARHGMTAGELARMYNEAFGIRCDLTVVAMRGWRRRMFQDETGLPWVPPSPNMPTPHTALVYPGACLLEGTNLSEGRGTTRPFEQFGAPWVDGPTAASTMNAIDSLASVARAVTFRPMFQKHAGEDCGGLFVHVTDRNRFRSFSWYLNAIRLLRETSPDRFRWRREPYEFVEDRLAIDLLLGRPGLREALEGGASVEDLEGSWSGDLERFRRERRPFLLYPE